MCSYVKIFSSNNFLNSSGCEFHDPLDASAMQELMHKKFSDETSKKICWVTKMFCEWRSFRNSKPNDDYIHCDMDDMSTITEGNIISSVCRFITEVKKLDGSEFPGCTLYDIVICLQFHLETRGFSWKFLSQDMFKDIRFTLDNLMKDRCARGIGVNVQKAQILSQFHEEIFWSMGVSGVNDPSTLLNSLVYMLGKGFALQAGQEHRSLKCPQFTDQVKFMHDEEGCVFVRYSEERGCKTNKGGLKHHKVEPKVVDMYAIKEVDRCPVRLLLTYLSKLPRNRKCHALYLQPHKKFKPNPWYYDRPVGANTLRDTVKEMCSKAGFPGFFSNHSLRSTSAPKLYRGKFDEQLIQEITGHRSLAVRSYKRTSDSQRKEASNCLFSR